MFGAALTASSQTQGSPSSPNDEIKSEAAKLYADAHPYLDEPLPKLRKTVHELTGLEPVPSQDQLSGLLAKVGAKADELLRKVPNLISDEAVTETQWSVSQAFSAGSGLERDQKFNYIVLAHPAQAGRLRPAGSFKSTGPAGTASPSKERHGRISRVSYRPGLFSLP